MKHVRIVHDLIVALAYAQLVGGVIYWNDTNDLLKIVWYTEV